MFTWFTCSHNLWMVHLQLPTPSVLLDGFSQDPRWLHTGSFCMSTSAPQETLRQHVARPTPRQRLYSTATATSITLCLPSSGNLFPSSLFLTHLTSLEGKPPLLPIPLSPAGGPLGTHNTSTATLQTRLPTPAHL